MSLRSLLSAFSTYAAKGLLSSASYVIGEDRDGGFFLWAVKRTARFLLMFGGRFVPRIGASDSVENASNSSVPDGIRFSAEQDS